MTRKMTIMAMALSALMLFAATGARAEVVDISKLKSSFDLRDGDVLTGTTTKGLWIADGLTLTFSDVNISCDSYCVQCSGSATIILADETVNTLVCTGDGAAINAGTNTTTLTIRGGAAGTGVLNATGGGYGAGIGGGGSNSGRTCGNIVIEGGVITAQGGERSAGIGGDSDAICGDITILGGTITATGGEWGAGIGSGGKAFDNVPTGCGNIIISGGTVTATGGKGAAGIGSGGKNWQNGTMTRAVFCGDITIAETVTKVTAKRGADGFYPGLTLIPAIIGAGIAEDPYGNANAPTCGTVTVAPELSDTTTGDTRIIERGAVLSGYAAWAADNGKGEWNEKSDGVYNVFRYVFDVPTGNAGAQITNIVVEGGTAKVMTPKTKNTEGVTVWVVESSDVAGAFATKTNVLDAAGTNTFTIGNDATHRFYRLSATLTE